jgi:hypothetical protein
MRGVIDLRAGRGSILRIDEGARAETHNGRFVWFGNVGKNIFCLGHREIARRR